MIPYQNFNLFLNHPKLDIHQLDDWFEDPFYAPIRFNFYAVDLLTKKFPDYFNPIIKRLIITCCQHDQLMSTKNFFKYLLINSKGKSGEKIIEELKREYLLDDDIC